MEWVFNLLTAVFTCWFVVLLLNFNKPSRNLLQKIEEQEARRQDYEQRLGRAREEGQELVNSLGDLEKEWDALEARREGLLERANKKRLVQIPAGPFTMGSRSEDSPRNERPVHVVQMSAYYIAPMPVTNQDYREFVNCTGHAAPIHWHQDTFPTGTGRHPVTNVSWHDAQAYAQWVGARLPTEAEWEKAARGNDERLYPWGPRWIDERCNSSNVYSMLLPVDEFPAGRSPYGLWDMAGNAYEWCQDYYDEEYYHHTPSSDPEGPEGGSERVIRGGFYGETRAGVRTTHRAAAAENFTRETIGFRIAMDAG